MHLADRIYVISQKVILLFRRTMRRGIRVFKTCKHLFWLLPLWALFLYIVFLINPQQKTVHYIDVLWDAKVPIFSSLIITGFTNVYLNESKRHKNLKLQFDLYSRTESAFLQVIVSSLLNDKDCSYRYIFLTQEQLTKCLESASETIKENGFVKMNPSKLFCQLSKADILLNEIARQYYSGQLEGCPLIGYVYGHEDMIHDAMILHQKLRLYFEDRSFNAIAEEIPHLANLYYNILGLIRMPWRLDFVIDQKIRAKYGKAW